jgi:steroid 5-alpha reductase family enzyme
MINWHAIVLPAGAGLMTVAGIVLLAWGCSVVRRNAGIADVVWGLFVLSGAAAFTWMLPVPGPRAGWLLAMIGLWALRLSAYIGWRSHGQPEDRRYQDIRARNQPNFDMKSLYLVFGLQGVLAWLISMPLFGALASDFPLTWLDAAGIAVFSIGFLFESIADLQLAAFRKAHLGTTSANTDTASGAVRPVMNRGLWRYSRHPNYFGECCVWWGFYLIALSAGAGWTLFSPLMMTVLLLKVSGVALLEKDMVERRPAYRDYIDSTNAFFPGPPRYKRTENR